MPRDIFSRASHCLRIIFKRAKRRVAVYAQKIADLSCGVAMIDVEFFSWLIKHIEQRPS